MQLEQDLEACDRRFSVRHLEFLVDGRSEQKVTHGVHQLAAPKLVGMSGCHADHVEERGAAKLLLTSSPWCVADS